LSRKLYLLSAILFGIIINLLAASCVTTLKQRAPAAIPIVFQPMFQNCWPADSDALLTVKKSGIRVFSSNMVWSIVDARNADIQFNSILGDTVFEVSRRMPSWNVVGPKGLKISENIQGIVSIDGFEIPILAEEIGCVLSGVWPSAWLQQLTLNSSSAGQVSLKGQDVHRDFAITMKVDHAPKANRADDIQSCTVLKWGGFLGVMRRKVTLCREQTGEGLLVSLTGVNDYLVEWVIQNES